MIKILYNKNILKVLFYSEVVLVIDWQATKIWKPINFQELRETKFGKQLWIGNLMKIPKLHCLVSPKQKNNNNRIE